MTVKELKEAVAHNMDEEQIEEESYFYTAINSAVAEILARFPIVKSITYTPEYSESYTSVIMAELTDDYATFSNPVFEGTELYSPNGRPIVDGRLGTVTFPPYVEGRITIFYNAKIDRINRDTVDVPFNGDRLELLILGTAYRLLATDDSAEAAKSVRERYETLAAYLKERDYGRDIQITDVYGW